MGIVARVSTPGEGWSRAALAHGCATPPAGISAPAGADRRKSLRRQDRLQWNQGVGRDLATDPAACPAGVRAATRLCRGAPAGDAPGSLRRRDRGPGRTSRPAPAPTVWAARGNRATLVARRR